MGLREGDLKDTVLKRISLDEFHPKTGDEKDVAVVGFRVSQSSPGNDLYKFLNRSVIETRDIEVSPNANDDGHYMVFIEMDRNEKLLDNIRALVKDVEHVSTKLPWKVTLPYLEEEIDLLDEGLDKHVQVDPDQYLTASEYREKIASDLEAEKIELEQAEAMDNSNKILEFLKNTNILEAGINDNRLHIRGSNDIYSAEIVNFGNGKEVMEEIGISESAIKYDYEPVMLSKLNSMLGSVRALPINEYIVMFNNDTKDILVTKPV